ncbi:MAG: hypothetical protein ACFFE2_04930 [Candidatus Thorarchaeota archaeon]
MRRTLQVVLVMSFVAIFLISPVAAATSQGLEWGVAQGDVFTYDFKVVDEGDTIIDDLVNISIESAPGTIPDPLTDYSGIPIVDVNLVYANGTAMGFEALYLLGIALTGSGLAVPIGNFSLLSDLIEGSIFWTENHTLINDGTNWGAQFSSTDAETRMSVSTRYKKSDGMINRYSLEATNVTSGVSSTVSLTRTGGGLDIIGLLQDNILYVGIGVGVIVILGAVVCVRRR